LSLLDIGSRSSRCLSLLDIGSPDQSRYLSCPNISDDVLAALT
jgi:hypothetical protein